MGLPMGIADGIVHGVVAWGGGALGGATCGAAGGRPRHGAGAMPAASRTAAAIRSSRSGSVILPPLPSCT